jgi:hypothetical protein
MNPQIADYDDYKNYTQKEKVSKAMKNASQMLASLTNDIRNSAIPQMREM